jgi:hypothetical protein
VFRQDLPTDEFDATASTQLKWLKRLILQGSYGQVFGFLQYALRHSDCPSDFAESVEMALKANMAGYRLVDGKTFFPITSEEDAKVAEKAFAALASSDAYAGAREHFTKAAERLTAGDWSGGVESVVRVLTGKKTFSDAIAVIEQRWGIHGALKRASSVCMATPATSRVPDTRCWTTHRRQWTRLTLYSCLGRVRPS